VERDVIWLGREWPGAEFLWIRSDGDGDGVRAEGTIAALVEDRPMRLAYRLRCDGAWCVRSMEIEASDGSHLALTSDGAGSWTDEAGRAIEALAGCLDVDLRATPFTNTLPIRRLGLKAGQEAELRVAFVLVPGLSVSAMVQRYACLEWGPDGGVFRYSSGDFQADLQVDRDGLVTDYPEGWVMAGPSASRG
jgi:uncharacterized protein